jgi:site-specific recombinase XerC
LEFLQKEELTMDTTITKTPVNPLRQRMQHDMMMRGLGPHTQHDYIRHVRRLSAFLGRPPDTATADDLRSFQIHQHERGASASTINGAVSALRFFYGPQPDCNASPAQDARGSERRGSRAVARSGTGHQV